MLCPVTTNSYPVEPQVEIPNYHTANYEHFPNLTFWTSPTRNTSTLDDSQVP